MTIWLYTMSWNEERMLPFFFRHYDPWIDRYVVYDDGSSDRTLDILAAHTKVTVRRFERTVPESFVASATLLQNSAWKEARGHAAWVVITAIDEHLYHPDMSAYLAQCRGAGVSAIPALGFQMLTETFPDSSEWLAETQRIGAPFKAMNKLSVFDPNMIHETGYALGRHVAAPTGHVVYPAADDMVNLHYKYLGDSYLESRDRLLLSGLGVYDRSLGLGVDYHQSPADRIARRQEFSAQALDYRDPCVGFTTHVERWWREPRRGS